MIEGLKPYTEYKKTGQDWLGELPVHWGLRRAKYLFREIDERSQTGKEELLSVSHITGVTPRSQKSVTMFLAESNVGHKICRPDDVVINTLWAWMAALGVARQTGIVSPAYGVYRPLAADCFLPRYSDLLLRTPAYAAEYQRRSTGVNSSRLRLYTEYFLRIPLIYPPTDEQAAIVRFLDHANREIDRFIRTKRRLIELLNEQKQIIIHRAVTRGIDPNVRLKPSGIDWLGDVPEHWEVKRLKHACHKSAIYGANESSANYIDNGVRFLRTTDINDLGALIPNIGVFIDKQAVADYILEDGDILLSRSGTIGRSFLYDSSLHEECAYAGYLVRFQLKPDYIPKFVFYFTKSNAFVAWLNYSTIESTIGNVNGKKYANLSLAFPPLKEQHAIAAFLDSETSRFNSLIAQIRKSIEKLREYRTCLISDVITGKVDVRGVVIPAMDEAETLEDIDTGEDTETEAQELIESEEVADADE